MSGLRIRAGLALLAVASVASAVSGYRYLASHPQVPAQAQTAAVMPPATAAKQGPLAFISPALRRELESLALDATTGVFVHFTPEALAQRAATLERHGLTVVNDFHPWADSVYATGTAKAFFAIAAEAGVYYLEQNEKLEYFNHTANWAIRTRFAQERVGDGPYYDANGDVLTGKGVGVAVVDSGADGRHPDFQHALKRNYKVLAAGNPVDVGLNASSDTTGGHGVHVAGTIMADGSASTVNYPDAAGTPYIKGSFSGVAPDVSLYAYGCGEAISVAFATQAFQHILANYDDRTIFPERIRVINNSYGAAAGGAYSATSTQSQLTKSLVAKGVSVVFAAGNSGDATVNDTTSPTCKDPTPGVICVASYDDLGTGSREGVMSNFTSQGAFATPTSFPDMAAPGHNITSTCSTYLPICKNTDPLSPPDTAFLPFYGTISGTSMATPHTSGVIALLLQARPDLTPDAIEKLLQNTSGKVVDNVYGAERAAYVPDPQNPGGATINYRVGAGLIDLPSALDALEVPKFGSLPTLAETTVISGDANVTGGADDGSPSATGANDMVSLKLTEETKGGVQGLSYRLAVADATDLAGASYVRYQVINNVNGKHFTTSVTLTETGVIADGIGASTSAAATSAKLEGNVISFFVPLGSLGSPPIGSALHNLRLVATSDLNGADAEVDYAPSGDPLLGTSATAPGFGRPYTILTAATAVTENRCEAPGITLLTDAGGDSLTADSSQDVLSASVAQPLTASGNPNLVFTIKVASLAALKPSSGYFVSFKNPDDVVVGVRMEVINPTAPAFFTYTASPSGGTPPQTDGRFVDAQVPAAAGSGYDAATGTITIVATPESLGLAPGQSLVGFNGGVTQSTDPGVGIGGATAVTDEMPDGLGRVGEFEYKSNAFCAPNGLPVAILKADKTSGPKPLTVAFSGSDSTDDDGIVSYTFRPGDGGATETKATPSFSYQYQRSGVFTADLRVMDSRGAESSTLSQVTISIENLAPVADLKANPTSGTVPFTVAFDALASSDPNVGDSVVSYSYDLDGDGNYEIIDSDSAKPSFTYNTAGNHTATVKVKDSEGLESTAAMQTITVSDAPVDEENVITISSFTADAASYDVTNGPVTVNFSVTASNSDPAAGALSYTYYYGDGSNSDRISSATSSHSYDKAGTYTVTVIATDEQGNSATADTSITTTTTVTVMPGPVTAALNLSLQDNNSQVPATAMLDGSGSVSYEGAIYRFSFGDGTADQVGTAKIARHVYTKAGSYTVTLTVTDKDDASNTSTATASVTITAAQQTVAQLSVSPAVTKVGQQVTFDASASLPKTGSSISSYRFDFGDGTQLEGTSAVVKHAYSTVGSFTPSVTVTDSETGTSTSKVGVRVDPVASPTSPTTTPTPTSSFVGAASGRSGGGALPVWTLLPLLALAGLRRRKV